MAVRFPEALRRRGLEEIRAAEDESAPLYMRMKAAEAELRLAEPMMPRVLLCALLLSALVSCRSYTYQLNWPEGTTVAQHKKDSYECEIETRSVAHTTLRPGTLYNRCMEARGYELVRVPRRQPKVPAPPDAQ